MDQEKTFQEKVIEIIKSVPRGKVVTYGSVAAYAGSPRAARQVVRILHSSSEKHNLPWHRVINREGKISLQPGQGYELQKALLQKEKVIFELDDSIDLDRYLWSPK